MNRYKGHKSRKKTNKKILNKHLRKSTIMGDIFKSVLLSAFATLFVLLCTLGYYMYQRNIKYSVSMLEEETNSITVETDHYFKDIMTIMDILSYSQCLYEANESPEKRELLLEMISDIEKNKYNINSLFIGYTDSFFLTDKNIFPENYNFQESQWYKDALITHDSNYSVGKFSNLTKGDTPKFFISKSFSQDGVKRGVIGVDCILDPVYNLFGSKSLFESKTVMLVNSVDQLILSKNPTMVDEMILANHPEMFNSKKTSFKISQGRDKFLVYSHQLVHSDWFLVSKINFSEITSPILPRVLILSIALIIITIVVSKIYSIVLGRTIAKPVLEVSLALQSLAKGNRNIDPIEKYPQNEIGMMAKSFNTFLKNTEILKADINELKETKADLSYSLSLLNASLESTDDGILIINNNGYITKWNQRFLEIWGITDEEIHSRVDANLLPRVEDKIINADEFISQINKVMENPKMVSFDIVEFKNGTVIERYSYPQQVEDKIVGRVWRYRDITQIRKSELLLKDSEEKHRVMFTQTVDAYCIIDNGVFTEVNHAADKMLNSPKGWLAGKTPEEISPEYQPDGKLSRISAAEHIEMVKQKGKHSFDWIHLRYDGSQFPAEITLITIKLKEKNLILAIWKDVTEEREIAEKLKISEKNFRLFFETMEDMIFISDYQGKLKYTNRIVSEKLGYSFDELKDMTIIDLHENNDGPSLNEIMTYLIDGNGVNCPLPVKRKDGDLIGVETRTWLGKWNGEECLFGISKDISKQQEALMNFNKIFESNPALMALSSYPERRFIDVNNSFCKTLGYNKEDVLGKTTQELNLTMEMGKLDRASSKLLAEGNFTNLQLKVSKRDGRIIEGLFSGELIETNGKKFFLTVMTDITNMKKLDRKLRVSERKYRLLFENMTTGFALHEMIYDEDGKAIDYRFLDINPAFEEYTGAKAEQLIGRTVKEVFPQTEDYWIDTYGKVAKTGESINYEQYSQEFGKYFEVKAFSPEPNKFAVIFSDTTARVKALKDLEKEKELAQAATKAKSEFLANMSHEIRTPLNGVIGFTDLLLSTDLTEGQKQFAVNANVSGKALLGIISDILDFSKIEAGKMELDIVNSSITEIMEQAVDIIKFSACKKGLDVILNLPVNFPERAMVDPLRLKQILLNLLNNAVKFTKEGEIELSAKFISHNQNSGKFIFSVKDTGIGISEEASKRLFKAFSQADGSITRKYGGTGLGLVISNYLAAKMGSHIDFISEEANGSEFYFAIDTEYVEKSTSRKDIFKNNRVLLADQNVHFMETVKMRLEYWGIEVSQATKFEEIAKAISQKNYRALIVDERLISNDDYQDLNQLLSKSEESKNSSIIITYCPNDNVEIVNISKGINANHIMTKPLMINDLFTTMKSICDQKKITKSNSNKGNHSIRQIESNRPYRILIAEDVEMNMVLIKTLIKKIIPNVEIKEARNGMEAVHIYKQESPDLILMDIQMPELDGLGATKAIKKLEQDNDEITPIVALTAGAFSDDKEKCLKAGMVDFLTKPISVKELTIVLEKFLMN